MEEARAHTPHAIEHRTRRLDLASSLLAAGFLAVIEMGGAIAKKGFAATDFEVALLTSGQSLGLIASFFVAHRASHASKMPLVLWPELAARLVLLPVAFLQPRWALAFVGLHALAQMFQSITIPARVTIYNLNYPPTRRGRIVGRIRQLQLIVTAGAALALSLLLDWTAGERKLVELLGDSPFPADAVVHAVPLLALVGIAGSVVFGRIPVHDDPVSRSAVVPIAETFRRFRRVWREDRDFRRYQNYFFLFGFANIMTIPLTQIHAVEALQADYFDLALINVVLVQALMAVSMAFWGRKLDRHPPNFLRGVLNLIFSIDFLLLAFAPSIEWVYLGRLFRGIALGGGTLIWMLGSLYYARSREEAPIYLGIHTVLTGTRWLTAPFVGVILKNFAGSARPVFLLSGLVIAATAVLMIRQSRREPPRPLPTDPMPAPRSTGA